MESACACLAWDAVYASRKAMCSEDGHESTAGDVAEGLQQELCSGHFERLNASFCVNRYGEEESGSQWCYVKKECATLSGFAPGGIERYIGEPLAIKTCTAEHDILLQRREPQELIKFARANGVDIGWLARMAYPVQRKPLSEIQALWQSSRNSTGGAASARAWERGPAAPSTPSVWLAEDGNVRAGFLVVHRERAWLLGNRTGADPPLRWLP